MKPFSAAIADRDVPSGYDAPEPAPTAATSMGGARDEVGDLFRQFASRVYGYVRLRADADTADEVVADTFVTAWRLKDRVPDEPLPWLLVIARNALANRSRSLRRLQRLAATAASAAHLARPAPAAGDIVEHRQTVLTAVTELDPADREALLLTAWDGLTITDAAAVAGCTPRTIERRLARARRHLDRATSSNED